MSRPHAMVRSMTVKFAMFSSMGSMRADGRLVESYDSDGNSGAERGTANDTEGQNGNEETIGQENDA